MFNACETRPRRIHSTCDTLVSVRLDLTSYNLIILTIVIIQLLHVVRVYLASAPYPRCGWYACKRAARFDQLQLDILDDRDYLLTACIVMYPSKKLYMILRPVELNGCSIGSTRWGTMYTCVYYVYFLIRNNLGLKISKIFD